MRKSKVIQKLQNGDVALCIKLNLADARAAEIAAMSGFDCIWTDMEHVPNDYSSVENIIRTAKIYNTDVLTRVSKGSYSDYIKPLEIDSAGIMIPHVMSLKEAQEIVYWSKFHPIGRRPLDGGNADADFCRVDLNEYMQFANREKFIAIQIEDPEPLNELEEICALQGIDMIFFGPSDFSQGIGKPNDLLSAEIINTRRLVAKTARKYGKYAGTVGSPNTINELVLEGYNFINIGADVVGLGKYYDDLMKKTNKCFSIYSKA